MSINKFNPRTIAILAFVIVAGGIRTYLSMDENMFGLSNFSPLGAMALFGGVYFRKNWKAFLFPISTLLTSDLVLEFTVFHDQANGFLYHEWYYVYGAFLMMVFVGRTIRKVRSVNILLGALAVVLIHWLVTDFPVWLNNPKYPQTLTGYFECLVVAIPFEWRFLTGTLIHTAILFGTFECLQKKYPALKLQTK